MFYVFIALIVGLGWAGYWVSQTFGQMIGIAFGLVWMIGTTLYLFQALDENWDDGSENDGEHLVFSIFWPIALPIILWVKYKDRELIALRKKLKQELFNPQSK